MKRFPWMAAYWRKMLPSIVDWAMVNEREQWQRARITETRAAAPR